ALPPYRIDVDGDVAEFSIGRDEARQVLWRARRAGTRLDLEETTALRRLETNDDDLHTVLCSLATLSVALAARGWPLIRSDAAWAERRKTSGSPRGSPTRSRSSRPWRGATVGWWARRASPASPTATSTTSPDGRRGPLRRMSP